MEPYEGLIPLSPPLAVQGTVHIVPKEDGGEPIPFTDGLAVASFPHFPEGADFIECVYIVVLPNGRMYEVSDHHLTAAKPWTPAG